MSNVERMPGETRRTITVRELRELSKELSPAQLEELRKEVEGGKVKIVPSPRARRPNLSSGEAEVWTALAKRLSFIGDQLPEATRRLAVANVALGSFIAEWQRCHSLLAQQKRDQAARRASIVAAVGSGVILGFFSGLAVGVVAGVACAGEGLRGVAERAPIPIAGGLGGLVVYAITHLGEGLTQNSLIEAAAYFAVGVLGVPAVVGVARRALRRRD